MSECAARQKRMQKSEMWAMAEVWKCSGSVWRLAGFVCVTVSEFAIATRFWVRLTKGIQKVT